MLAERLPTSLRPLAALAYNLAWSWMPGGAEVFAAIDQHRWDRCGHNPVRLLSEAPVTVLADAASRDGIVTAAADLFARLQTELERPSGPGPMTPAHPVAFLCAEFGVHSSLPIYSGGLGVLAGDVLKTASDLRAAHGRRRAAVPHRATSTSASTSPATSTSTGPTSIPTGCRAVPGERSERRAPERSRVPIYGRGRDGRGLAGRRRTGAPLPAGHRRGRELPDRALGDLPALRGQPATSGWRSTACSASVGVRALRALGHRARASYHLNEGHARLGHGRARRSAHLARACPPDQAWRAGATVGRLHDPHTGGGGERDVLRRESS